MVRYGSITFKFSEWRNVFGAWRPTRRRFLLLRKMASLPTLGSTSISRWRTEPGLFFGLRNRVFFHGTRHSPGSVTINSFPLMKNFWERFLPRDSGALACRATKENLSPFSCRCAFCRKKCSVPLTRRREAPNSQTSCFLETPKGTGLSCQEPEKPWTKNGPWRMLGFPSKNSDIRPFGACGLGRYSFPTPYGTPSSKSIRRHKACSLIWSMRLNENKRGTSMAPT